MTLYASLGSDCFASFHDALRGAAERGAVRYVHRPVLLDAACALQGDGCVALGAAAAGSAISGDASGDSAGSGSGPGAAPPAEGARLTAAGYGVEMAIKNMEYKAIDDASIGEDAAVSAASGVDESAPELKLRQIRDLGLQATQRVARSDDPLQTMMDLSFDFPAIAAELSAVRVDEATAAAAAENAQKLGAGGGSLVMSLNGEPLEMETVNVFSLLDRVADELKLADAFLGLKGMDHAVVRKLMRMRVAKGGANANGAEKLALDFPRLDVVRPELDPSSPRFANDVEKDRAFKSWDPSLSGLLLPDPAGGPPRVRRNLLNFVAVVQLGDDREGKGGGDAAAASWALVDALDRAAEQGVGFRVAHALLGGDPSRSRTTPTPLTTRTTERATPTCPPASASPRRWPARAAALARAPVRGVGTPASLCATRARAAGGAVGELAEAPPARAGAPTWRGEARAFARAHRRGFRAAEKKRRKKAGEESGWTKMDEERSDADFEATLTDALRVDGGSAAAAYDEEARAYLRKRGVEGVGALVNGLHFTLDDARRVGADVPSLAFHLAQRELDAAARAVYAGSSRTPSPTPTRARARRAGRCAARRASAAPRWS